MKPKKSKIEDTVVGTYQKIEDAVVGTYQKIEDKFVEKFLDVEEEIIEIPEEDIYENHGSDHPDGWHCDRSKRSGKDE